MKKPHTFAKLLLMALFCTPGITSRAQTYCTPTYSYPQYACSDYYGRLTTISLTGENGIDLNDTPPCDPVYFDRTTALPALNVTAGNTYYGSTLANDRTTSFNIWIDLNDDGTFATGERLFQSNYNNYMFNRPNANTAPFNHHVYGITLAIPVNAPAGTHRMRIRSTYQSSATGVVAIDPCSAYNGANSTLPNYYGTTADYLVNISAASSCGPQLTTLVNSVGTCPGSNASFTAAFSNATSLQWQVNDGSGYTNLTDGGVYSGSTTGTLTITGTSAAINGHEYRCIGGNGTCITTSNRAALWLKTNSVTTQPVSKTVVLAGSTSFSISTSFTPSLTNTYQWQVNDGSGFVNVVPGTNYAVNSTALTLTNATLAMNNYQYRCVVTTNAGCATESNAATLTVLNTMQPPYKYASGNTSFSIPFSTNNYMKQSIYTPGDFGNAPSGLISKIYLRAGATTTGASFTNFRIKLGQSPLTGLTSAATGLTEVRHDSLYILPAMMQDEWIAIALETPFYYDSTKSMIVEISQTARTGTFTLKVGSAHINPAYTSPNSVYGPIGGSTFTTSLLTHAGLEISPCLSVTGKPGNLTVSTDINSCSASNVSLGTPTATSSCGIVSFTNNAPAIFPKGSTVVTWMVTDGTATDSFTQTVTVNDNTAPTIVCPANITVTAAAGACSANVSYAIPTVTDNCGSCISAPVPTSIPGYTALGTYNGHTYFFSNTAGYWEDFNTYAQSVGGHLATIGSAGENNFLYSAAGGEAWVGLTDKDVEGTFIWSNGEPVVYTGWCQGEPNNAGDEDYTLAFWGEGGCWNDGGATRQSQAIIEFDCTAGNTIDLARTAGPASGGTFPTGTTTVTYTAADAANNSSSCSFTVTVLPSPNNNVSISVTPANNTYTGGVPTNIYIGYGPQSATLNAMATGGTGFTYAWSPAAGLNCTNCQSPVITPTAAGNYTYTVTATNSNGCSTTGTITLCVLDVRATNGNNKVYLCHNGNTLSISANAVPAHLNNHGDQLGNCNAGCGTANKNSGEENIATEEYGALHHEFGNDEIRVYPNPNNGQFVIELPAGTAAASISIVDMTGKTIQKLNAAGNEKISIDLGSVARGIYMIQINGGAKIHRSKVTVQ